MISAIDRDLVVQLTQDLVRFPSVNPPGNEREAAEFLGARMSDLGLEVEVQILEETRANVIGRIRGTGKGHLVFSGHLDVVPPGEQPWHHAPFAAERVDGRIYGRGSCDMKGGVASMVTAAAALVQGGFRPNADLIIAASCGEEAGMLGAGVMVERRSLEGAASLVVCEPTGLDVYIGEKGVFWIRIRAFGQTAHGSTPWLGINAVSYFARLIPRLEAYPFTWQESDLLGKPSLSVNIIRGGNKVNVVADFCEIDVDLRTVPSQDQGQLLEQIRALAEEVAAEFHSGLRIELEIDQAKQSLETPRNDALVETTILAVEAIRGKTPLVGGVTYGTDAAYLAPGFNIPMVICGPGGTDMLHQPNEYVEIEQLFQAAEIYVDLAKRLLG
jgi:succinyl-diaminopimelate desuccinylase